jgi:D-3-phosphoglycerate dehydrogenase
MGILRPYVVLAEKLGSLQGQLAESGILEVQITYSGKVAQYDAAPLSTAVLKGLLAAITGDEVNFINALPMASDRGIKVVESKTSTSEDFASLIKVGVRTLEGDDVVSGTIFGRTRPRILRINDFYMEAVPEGHILFIHSQDVPGVIGRIATALGAHGVNIDRMHVGQDKSRQRNVILLATSVSAQDHVLEDVLGLDQVYSARRIEL